MQQSTTKITERYEPELTAIRGYLMDASRKDDLVNAAWNFAYSSLWNATHFSAKEISTSKEKIAEYFTLAKNSRKAFLSFCQRVLLARQYITSTKGRYIPLPSLWLSKENETGFAGTKDWYNQIKAVRTSLPNHKEEIKALAEAVLEYSEEPTPQTYHYWKAYFIEKGTPGLLSLFQVYAINQQFN